MSGSNTLAKLKRLLIIHMLIRIIRSPKPQSTYIPIVFETVSPLWLHDPLPHLEMTAPLSSDVAMGVGMPSTSSPKPEQLKRVLSSGSNGSGAILTPKNGHAPLSPSSGGTRTPKAGHVELMPSAANGLDGKKDGERLATDLNQLKVQSPTLEHGQLPSISQSIDIPATNPGSGHVQAHRQASTNSSSTDSSSNHPFSSSSLGTNYGPEGFPRTTTPGEETQADPYIQVQAMAAAAAADEAIKQINGTSSIRTAPNLMAMGGENPFTLPRGYANFVTPQYRDKPQFPPDYSVSRQSSTSSSTTTEASTSSEESDLCIPSIEWVNTKPNMMPPAHPTLSPYQYTPYMPNAVPQVRARSPVPPPRPAHPLSTAAKATSSPRRSSGGHTNGTNGNAEVKSTLPLGATAHTPSGVAASSALPSGMAIDEPAEDDDDEQTVGQNRSRSRSRSASSESNLDLLSHVASSNHQASSAGQPTEGKGKRKAGSRSVAQWRESGIPSGVDSKANAVRRTSAAKTVPPVQSTPPRKRRRSEMSDTNIDPALRSEGRADRGEPAMEVEEELASEKSSGSDEELNSGDSEYAASPPSKTKPKPGRSKGGRKVGGTTRGRHSLGAPSKTAPKKTKRISGSPADSNRRASTGSGLGAGAPAGGVQCEYVNPLPVSLLSFRAMSREHSLMLTVCFSLIIDVRTSLHENTIFHDIWPDMHEGKENWWWKGNWQRIKRHYGRLSRINQKSLATSAARALRGMSISLSCVQMNGPG